MNVLTLISTAAADGEIVKATLATLAIAFCAFSIPGGIIWFARTLTAVKKSTEVTETILTGPTGLVKEIERIRTNVHRSNDMTQSVSLRLALVEENLKKIESDLEELRNE